MTDKKTGALKLALEALERVNNTTLALKAMVPECREFAAIAQDLDCVIPAIREALAEQPAPPPECKTDAEKTAFAFGWWKALEENRKQPAQQQEPVAWILKPTMELLWPDEIEVKDPSKHRGYKPLYTSPQPSKPWVGLTAEEIAETCGFGEYTTTSTRITFTHLARAIEAKLKEKNA